MGATLSSYKESKSASSYKSLKIAYDETDKLVSKHKPKQINLEPTFQPNKINLKHLKGIVGF